MGFLDLFKGTGIFNDRQDKQIETIKNMLENEVGNNIENLQIEFKNNIMTISGICDTFSTKKKAVEKILRSKGVRKINDRLTIHRKI